MSFHAIILAAGRGTRMRSSLAKVLHPVLGQPMVAWVVDAARRAGAAGVTVVVGHQGAEVASYLQGRYADVTIAWQHETLGTGHAAQIAVSASPTLEGPVALLCGDVPNLPADVLASLVQAHESAQALVSVVTASLSDPSGYGRIVRDDQGRATRIVEEKDASPEERALREVNTGTYVMDAAFLRTNLARLDRNNAQGEMYLTDVVAMAAEEGRLATWAADRFDVFQGVNDRAQLAAAEDVARSTIVSAWMREGVTFCLPTTVRIGPAVRLAPDVTIEGGVTLLGDTQIGEGTTVEQGARLHDTSVGARAHIKAYTVAHEAELGDAVHVGPFVHLRPGTRLDAGVRLGNFVETKKAHFGPGAKANHLSYIGDAEIGAGTNIGAGTITCNYDGVNKHKTVLGEGVFIGSDTQLVAPVTVGDGAYVAAGTTVTKDVPPSALAISRVPQRHIENWVERKSAKRDDRSS